MSKSARIYITCDGLDFFEFTNNQLGDTNNHGVMVSRVMMGTCMLLHTVITEELEAQKYGGIRKLTLTAMVSLMI